MSVGWVPAGLPIASLRYLWPISLRYSSTAFVASVFSRKIKCSRSMKRSTSHMAMSDRNSWENRMFFSSGTERFKKTKILSSTCWNRWAPHSPLSSLYFEGCAPEQTPPPLCSSRLTAAPEPHRVFGSCWWCTQQTPYTAPSGGCSLSGSETWPVVRRWLLWRFQPRRSWPERWTVSPGTIAQRTADPWCWRWGCWQGRDMCFSPGLPSKNNISHVKIAAVLHFRNWNIFYFIALRLFLSVSLYRCKRRLRMVGKLLNSKCSPQKTVSVRGLLVVRAYSMSSRHSSQ